MHSRNEPLTSYQERLTADMKAAMKARDRERLQVIRMLINDLKEEQLRKGRDDLDEAEELAVLQKAVEQFEQTGEPVRVFDQFLYRLLQHGFYEQYQYLPLIFSCAETQQILWAALRPGTVHAALGADDDLRHIVTRLRATWPDVEIHVRGDAGFGDRSSSSMTRSA